jgi:hypothetical protein
MYKYSEVEIKKVLEFLIDNTCIFVVGGRSSNGNDDVFM